jgi:arginine utilization regulatory protein
MQLEALASGIILDSIEEGVHIVDARGFTVVYNRSMAKIEGLSQDQVMGRHLLDLFPGWTRENSTLLTVLATGKEIISLEQSYLNFQGKHITTVNTTRPIYDGERLIGAIEVARNTTAVATMTEEILDLRAQLNPVQTSASAIKRYHFDELTGKSALYLEAIKLAKQAAKSDSNVLIHGDTGTGKELFAQSIHSASTRKEAPFIAQNCAAIPETLLESLLFGTAKGSFTGAENRPGLFEQAGGGTLFLDEINNMPLALQAKILRVLQESYIRRVGGSKDIPIDVRIIAASNEDPEQLVSEGQLRKDLYYRLNVINIRIPRLNERRDDIPLLVDAFIREYNARMHKDVWMISTELMDIFMRYEWIGNIRELKNYVESAMNFITDEHVIGKEHLPRHVIERLAQRSDIEVADVSDLDAHLSAIERDILEQTFEKFGGNVTQAANRLGLSRQNLQYKLKKYHIAK